MMTNLSRRERRALAILLGLGVAGHLLRAAASAPAALPAAVQIFSPDSDGNPLSHLDSIRRQARPLGATERIDVDHASAEELARLPGVGPALAKRIVADRESHGLFGGTAGLRRVRGFGPATLTRLAPHLSFSGTAAETEGTPSTGPIDLNTATVAVLVGLPGIGPARARAIVAFRDSLGPFRQVEDLQRVPGIRASLIRQLVDRLVVH